jgi:hypothetical protein
MTLVREHKGREAEFVQANEDCLLLDTGFEVPAPVSVNTVF